MTRRFLGDTLVFATHNQGKLREARGLLAAYVPNVVSAGELGFPEPKETGTTFLENATMKALFSARRARLPALSEDSGLCVNALGGAPGVYSADWAGHPRNARRAMHRVHAEMGDNPDRSAYFTTVFVLAWPDGHIEYTQGWGNPGTIVWPPRGSGTFGYDPIFMPDGYAKTYAEMSIEEKKAISHRTESLNTMLDLCFR